MKIEQKNYFWLTAAVFAVIAVIHFFRLVYGWPAQIGEVVIPFTTSGLAVFIALVLAIAGFGHALKK